MLRKINAVREKNDYRKLQKKIGEQLVNAATRGDAVEVRRILSDCKHDAVVVNHGYTKRRLLFRETLTGASSLDLACLHGHRDVVDVLVKTPGINVNSQSSEFGMNTPLLAAVICKKADVVKILAACDRVDPNIQNDEGDTALTKAFRTCPQAVPLLFKMPTLDINKQNKRKHTPLMLAAKFGMLDHAKDLLSMGADTTLKDDRGRTAADIARQKGHAELAGYIEQQNMNVKSIHRNDTAK